MVNLSSSQWKSRESFTRVVNSIDSSFRPSSFRKRTRRGRSVDPGATDFQFPPGYQSSSDMSSPNETCYSFVRKAMQVGGGGEPILIRFGY